MDISNLKINTSHELKKIELPDELNQVFFSDEKFIPISHLASKFFADTANSGSLPSQLEIVERKLNLNNRLKYQRRPLEWKHSLHWGQLKLHLTEIEFLTIVMQHYNAENSNKKIVFVYVGAAPGQHNDALMDMFPNIHFELYDPNPFAVKPNERRKIHQRFFVDKDAKDLAESDDYIVFCSDIRTEPATDENVKENMDLQLKWWKIINPEWSMFKFRLPYAKFQNNKPIITKTKYPQGDIYVQPFVGPTSTETRLIVKKNAPIIDYDDHAYEEACFYNNTVTRTKKYKIDLIEKPTIPTVEFDQCFDCASMIYILEQWGKISKTKIDIEFVKEFIASVHVGKTMYSKTIEYTREMLSNIRRRLFVPCGNAKCNICENNAYTMTQGKSKATNEAFEKANKSDKTENQTKAFDKSNKTNKNKKPANKTHKK